MTPVAKLAVLVGLFVGGQGRRMGGIPKGLLKVSTGETLIERLQSSVRQVSSDAPIVLVGRAEAYAALGVSALDDAPSGIGPLGGLCALLSHAQTLGLPAALALSCDLPHITPALIARLATEQPGALALAPREGSLWSPLTARYSVSALSALDACVRSGEHSLQRVFQRLGDEARVLSVHAAERAALSDWDRPEDMSEDRSR